MGRGVIVLKGAVVVRRAVGESGVARSAIVVLIIP